MKYLKIQNNNVLDIRLVSLMGGTTKDSDVHKIGRFGTGLKYVLAYVLRNKVDFHICLGIRKVKVDTIKDIIQDKEFEIIKVDGVQTSITTNMGMDWKPWMIVREIYSNALDEGEAKYEVVEEDKLEGLEDKTTFYIELIPEFLEVYNNWTKYFIVNNVPMFETNKFAIHPANGVLRIYKQGILIKEENSESIFNYDIKEARINELREYIGHTISDIADIIFSITDKKTIEYFLENVKDGEKDKLFEATIDLNWWKEYSKLPDEWQEVLGSAKVIHSEAKKTIIAKEVNIDLTHTVEVPKNIYKVLTKSFNGIGAVRVADKVHEFFEIHDEELKLKVKQCLAILEEADYFVHPELTYTFGEFGNKSTLARVSFDQKDIMISQKMKDKSLFDFCTMLVEENEHFQTGYRDESRSFQQHFIDLYVKAILDKAEVKL